MAQMVQMAQTAHKAFKGKLELQARKACRVKVELQEQMVQMAQTEQTAHKDYKEYRVKPERKACRVKLVQQE